MRNKSIFNTPDGKNHAVTFFLIASLFLLWGFCNGMIDVMDKHFQQELHLSLAQSAWVQFAHYLGYFLMALPAGTLATRLGYKGGIITGLLLVALGGFWFIPATHIALFWAFLLGVCVIASGLTFLETIANPYTTVLGDPDYGATRINLAQSFNGIGWIFGPIAGGMFFYAKDNNGNSIGSQTLWLPYTGVAVVVVVLALIFYFVDLPDIKLKDKYQSQDSNNESTASVWNNKHFAYGVIAQFFYVAAQAGIFSFFINYMTSQVPTVPKSLQFTFLKSWFDVSKSGAFSISDQGAANLASFGFIFFLLGRFSGAAILRKIDAHRVLGYYSIINIVMSMLVFMKLGWISFCAIFLSYFFMSIMFPTIFALAIYGLGSRAKKASSYIVMAIMGGAILPKLMGYVADKTDISRGFIVPVFCFVFIAYYAFSWPKLSNADSTKVSLSESSH